MALEDDGERLKRRQRTEPDENTKGPSIKLDHESDVIMHELADMK